jgi:type I restriction enzyme S subunit
MTWTELALGEAIHVKHGFAFKGGHFVDEGEHIVLTPGNFFEAGGFRTRPGKDRAYAGDIPDDYVLNEGDLIVAMTEQGEGLLGSTAIIPASNKFLHNQRLGLIDKIDPRKVDKRFLYYLFNTPSVRGQIRGSASGTKVRHTAPERIYRVRARVPDVSTQKRIGEIATNYDNLISNNKRRIELLEESARLLFKEWFVRLRYPGHEHGTITDGVPQGWRRCKIEEVTLTFGGGTPSSSVPAFWDGGDVTWFVPTDITRNESLVILDSERKITESGLRNSSAQMLPRDAILMTSRASVGFFAIFDEKPCCTNQGFISIVPKIDHARYFMLFDLMNRREEIIGKAGGATYKEINKSTFRNMTMLIPTYDLRREFDEFAGSALQQVRTLKRQLEASRKARDLLLPRFMNGRIEV